MDYKNKLLELMAIAHQNEHTFISELGEQERNYRGTFQEWSAKDELVHIAAWKGIMCERFRAFQAGQTPPDFNDWDAVNEEIYQHHQDDAWPDALDYFELSYKQLVEQVQAISEEDLLETERYAWLQGRSLWRRTLHNGYFHPHGHIAFWYSKRGDPERGSQLMEEVTGKMQSLDESPAWQGQTIYNLACYYAVIGEREQAIERLGRAFSLRPDMVAWSREDSDLTSLWDDPEYLALVEKYKSN